MLTDEHAILQSVAPGLSLDSQAATCAEICGIPHKIAQRARYISALLSRHELGELLDEEMRAEECAELAAAEDICRAFLAWELAADDDDSEDPKSRLKRLLRLADGDDES